MPGKPPSLETPALETPVGFGALVGYRLSAWGPDHAEPELHLKPRHLNCSHVPHGGVIATLIDTACGFAGCYSAEPGKVRRAVTLALTTCFLGQAEAGTTLAAKARRTGGGRTVFFARCDLVDSAVADPDERAVDEDVLEIGIVRQSREQALPHALLRPPPKKANI